MNPKVDGSSRAFNGRKIKKLKENLYIGYQNHPNGEELGYEFFCG